MSDETDLMNEIAEISAWSQKTADQISDLKVKLKMAKEEHAEAAGILDGLLLKT